MMNDWQLQKNICVSPVKRFYYGKNCQFDEYFLKLVPGVLCFRKDTIGKEVITTFDLRMTSPNDEPVMNTAEVHTIEHLAATFLRNHPVYANKTIYFGAWAAVTAFICCWPVI